MPETGTNDTTIAPTRRAAILGAVAFPAIMAAAPSASAPVPLSLDFRLLRSLAIEFDRVMDDCDSVDARANPIGAKAGAMLMAECREKIARVVHRINAKPVRSLSDLLDRAAVVLYWADGGSQADAWPPHDPVAHLRGSGSAGTEGDGQAHAANQLAAAVFALARREGVNV